MLFILGNGNVLIEGTEAGTLRAYSFGKGHLICILTVSGREVELGRYLGHSMELFEGYFEI